MKRKSLQIPSGPPGRSVGERRLEHTVTPAHLLHLVSSLCVLRLLASLSRGYVLCFMPIKVQFMETSAKNAHNVEQVACRRRCNSHFSFQYDFVEAFQSMAGEIKWLGVQTGHMPLNPTDKIKRLARSGTSVYAKTCKPQILKPAWLDFEQSQGGKTSFLNSQLQKHQACRLPASPRSRVASQPQPARGSGGTTLGPGTRVRG